MGESRPTARERAFEIFKASGGTMPVAEIFQHLLAERYEGIKRSQLDTWKKRDSWVATLGANPKAIDSIDLQKMLLEPKLTILELEGRVSALADATDNILQLMTGLSKPLLDRVKLLKAEDIEVKNIAPLTAALGKIWTYYAVLEGEVERRRANLAKDITPPDAPAAGQGDILPPMAQRALAWEAERKGKR